MPFADPAVGGVSTRQSVYQADTSVWRRVADWIINNRYLDYVPATGRAGAVVCVSGRTAAYRREIVLKVLPHLEDEFFLGKRCIAGDDGRLTWLVLASGYRTVYQSTAHALSMFPTTFRAFCKQRVRWSRNSYRCYLTAMWKGWLWRVPVISQLTVFQILLTPVTMAATVFYLAISGLRRRTAQGRWPSRPPGSSSAGRRATSPTCGPAPSDILLLPLVALVITFVALPIKLYAFLTMNKQGWLTRHAHQLGGDGQNAASLMRGARRVAGLAASARATAPVRPPRCCCACSSSCSRAQACGTRVGPASRPHRWPPRRRPPTRPPTTGRRRS